MNLDHACRLSVDHLAFYGCSDITKEQLETVLMQKYQDDFVGETRSKINRGSVNDMEFASIQYILTPKNRYVFDYRKAAMISPACLAKYTALVLLAAECIEKARVPIEEQVVFSTRFSPDGPHLFRKDINYSLWRERVKELANSDACAYIVQCDIASFYDRVNIHRIQSTLKDIGVANELVKKIDDLLLFWSKKDSYGIPVGNSASRILAEAALIDIDNYLLSENVLFARYVDDYRLFAPDLKTAQKWMNLLTMRLFRDGLMLNTGKTKLYVASKSDEAIKEEKNDDAETIIKKVTALTGGYNRIARTFIMPAIENFEPFKHVKINDEISTLHKDGIAEFQGIQKLIFACLIQHRFDLLVEVACICGKYLYSLDYFVDMLQKNSEVIPKDQQLRIRDYYAEMIFSNSLGGLEWHQASLATLLSHEKYFHKPALMHIIRSPNKENATYPSMIALERIKENLTRGEFRTIREWFERSDDWEKRRIIDASIALPDDERKAWGRAVKPLVQRDFFGSRMADEVARGTR